MAQVDSVTMLGSKKRNLNADLHMNRNFDIFNKAEDQVDHFHNPYTEQGEYLSQIQESPLVQGKFLSNKGHISSLQNSPMRRFGRDAHLVKPNQINPNIMKSDPKYGKAAGVSINYGYMNAEGNPEQ